MWWLLNKFAQYYSPSCRYLKDIYCELEVRVREHYRRPRHPDQSQNDSSVAGSAATTPIPATIAIILATFSTMTAFCSHLLSI